MSLIKFIIITILTGVLAFSTWGTSLRGIFFLVFLISCVLTGFKTYYNYISD